MEGVAAEEGEGVAAAAAVGGATRLACKGTPCGQGILSPVR